MNINNLGNTATTIASHEALQLWNIFIQQQLYHFTELHHPKTPNVGFQLCNSSWFISKDLQILSTKSSLSSHITYLVAHFLLWFGDCKSSYPLSDSSIYLELFSTLTNDIERFITFLRSSLVETLVPFYSFKIRKDHSMFTFFHAKEAKWAELFALQIKFWFLLTP